MIMFVSVSSRWITRAIHEPNSIVPLQWDNFYVYALITVAHGLHASYRTLLIVDCRPSTR
jgi:hypothetical protein